MTINQDFDKVFKDGLKDYAKSPPSFVWDNIEQNLNKSRLKRKRNILYSVAASIALLIAFGSGYMLTTLHNNNAIVKIETKVDKKPVMLAEAHGNAKKIAISEDDEIKNNKKQKPELASQQEKATKAAVSKSESGESKPNKAKDEAVEQKSNIKKVNSAGTLLPPIFGSNDAKVDDANETVLFNKVNIAESNINTGSENNDSELSMLPIESFDCPDIENQMQLAYDDRLIKLPYELLYNEPATKDYSSWSVGFAATPLVSYRDVVNANSNLAYAADYNSSYAQDYKNEKPLTAYSAGVNVNYNVSKRLKIQSGVYYSEMGQVSQDIPIFPESAYSNAVNSSYSINTSVSNVAINNNQSEIVEAAKSYRNELDASIIGSPSFIYENAAMVTGKSVVTADFVQTYDFYEVPLILNYTVIDQKIAMNVSGGLSANILNSNKTYVKSGTELQELNADSQELNNLLCSGVVGLGVEYPIIDNLLLNLQPTFRYALNSINSSSSVYPYSFGVYTGLRYSF